MESSTSMKQSLGAIALVVRDYDEAIRFLLIHWALC